MEVWLFQEERYIFFESNFQNYFNHVHESA